MKNYLNHSKYIEDAFRKLHDNGFLTTDELNFLLNELGEINILFQKAFNDYDNQRALHSKCSKELEIVEEKLDVLKRAFASFIENL